MPIVFHSEFERYSTMLLDPANMDKTSVEFAAEIGVGDSTIRSWNRRIDWKEVNQKRRECYSRIMHTIDSALLKKAQKGDAEAIKLFYARFDGYVPLTGTIDLSDKKDDELTQRAQQIKVELLAKDRREGVGRDLSGASEASA